MDKTNLFKLLGENLERNRKGLTRLWLIMAGIHLTSLMLGFAVFLIVLGVQFAVRRIVIYWTPARHWLTRTFNLTFPEPDTSNVSPRSISFVNVYHLVIAAIYVVIGFYLVNLGVHVLVKDGFLGQNLIYQIFFRK